MIDFIPSAIFAHHPALCLVTLTAADLDDIKEIRQLFDEVLNEVGEAQRDEVIVRKIQSLLDFLLELHGDGQSPEPIVEGSVYRHIKSGSLYEVFTVAAQEADSSQQVVYKSVEDGKIYVRPASEFTVKFEKV